MRSQFVDSELLVRWHLPACADKDTQIVGVRNGEIDSKLKVFAAHKSSILSTIMAIPANNVLRWISLIKCGVTAFDGSTKKHFPCLEGLELTANHIRAIGDIKLLMSQDNAPKLLWFDIRENPIAYEKDRQSLVREVLGFNARIAVINRIRVTPEEIAAAFGGAGKECGEYQVCAAMRMLPSTHFSYIGDKYARVIAWDGIRSVNLSGFGIVYFSVALFPSAIFIDVSNNNISAVSDCDDTLGLRMLDLRKNPITKNHPSVIAWEGKPACILTSGEITELTAAEVSDTHRIVEGRPCVECDVLAQLSFLLECNKMDQAVVGAIPLFTESEYGKRMTVDNRQVLSLRGATPLDVTIEGVSYRVKNSTIEMREKMIIDSKLVRYVPVMKADMILMLLRSLDISHCNWSAAISFGTISKQCVNLEKLIAVDCNIESLECLQENAMVSLSYLDVSYQKHALNGAELKYCRYLPNLRYLNAYGAVDIMLDELMGILRMVETLNDVPNILLTTPVELHAMSRVKLLPLPRTTEYSRWMTLNNMTELDVTGYCINKPTCVYTQLLPISRVCGEANISVISALKINDRISSVSSHDDNVHIDRSVKYEDMIDRESDGDTRGDRNENDRVTRKNDDDNVENRVSKLGMVLAVLPRLQFFWWYFTASDLSTSGVYAYCMAIMMMNLSYLFSEFNMTMSRMVDVLSCIFLCIGPSLFLWLAGVNVYVVFTKKERRTILYAVPFVLSFSSIICCVIDYFWEGKVYWVSYVTILVWAGLTSLLFYWISVTVHKACKAGKLFDFAPTWERWFIFLVGFVQLPMEDYFFENASAYGVTSVIGVCSILIVVLSTSLLVVNLGGRVHWLTWSFSKGLDPTSEGFADSYGKLVVECRSPIQRLYEDYTYNGRYTNILQMCHRLVLSVAFLLSNLQSSNGGDPAASTSALPGWRFVGGAMYLAMSFLEMMYFWYWAILKVVRIICPWIPKHWCIRQCTSLSTQASEMICSTAHVIASFGTAFHSMEVPVSANFFYVVKWFGFFLNSFGSVVDLFKWGFIEAIEKWFDRLFSHGRIRIPDESEQRQLIINE